MNIFKDTFVEDNKEFIKGFYSGNIKCTVISCSNCGSVFMVEQGANADEYGTTCCPFCKMPTIQTHTVKPEEVGDTLVENSSLPPSVLAETADKSNRIMLDSENQQFNICACTVCNTRFTLLQEDLEYVAVCPYCESDVDALRWLIKYEDRDNEPQGGKGLLNSIGKLFYVTTKSGTAENFKLTDVDYGMKKYRFVSMIDSRMAFWIKEEEIIDMLEFIKTDDIKVKEE